MEQLAPSLRTRIYVIAALGVAGVVIDITLNASPTTIQPPPPRLPLLVVCLALNLVLLLLVSRLLEQSSEQASLRSYVRFVQVVLLFQLAMYALLLAAALGFLPAGGVLASLASQLTNLGANPSRYFAEFVGFLVAALLPLFILRDGLEPPVIPGEEE